jgi:hypothetical protein
MTNSDCKKLVDMGSINDTEDEVTIENTLEALAEALP